MKQLAIFTEQCMKPILGARVKPSEQPKRVRREVDGCRERLQECLSLYMRERYGEMDAICVRALHDVSTDISRVRYLHELPCAIAKVRRFCQGRLASRSRIERCLFLAQRWSDRGMDREARERRERAISAPP